MTAPEIPLDAQGRPVWVTWDTCTSANKVRRVQFWQGGGNAMPVVAVRDDLDGYLMTLSASEWTPSPAPSGRSDLLAALEAMLAAFGNLADECHPPESPGARAVAAARLAISRAKGGGAA